MDTRGLIKIDRCGLNQIIRSAYALSKPVGMGHSDSVYVGGEHISMPLMPSVRDKIKLFFSR